MDTEAGLTKRTCFSTLAECKDDVECANAGTFFGNREYRMESAIQMKAMQILRTMLSKFSRAAASNADCGKRIGPQPDIFRLADGLTTQEVRFFSTALCREMNYRVILPARLAPSQELPVVYLLHGMGDDYTSWSNRTDVARYATKGPRGGLIMVMPEGACSFYMNSAWKLKDRFEDYLTNDLISDVEARFPAAKGRANRAIVGISMGGFAAVKLALARPELFVFAGGLSPAVDVARRRFTIRHAGRWWRFRKIFGGWGSETRNSSDPFLLMESADPAATPYIYLAAGKRERLLEPNLRFAALLHELHFAYEIHEMPGGHDWGEWNRQLPECFASLFHHLGVAE